MTHAIAYSKHLYLPVCLFSISDNRSNQEKEYEC